LKNNKNKDVKKSYKSFRQRRLKIFLGDFRNRFFPIISRFIPIGIILLLLILVIVVFFIVKSNNYFKIVSIEIITEDPDLKMRLNAYLEKYKQYTLFTLNPSTISNDLKKNFSQIKEVYIDKSIKGEISIEIVKDIPAYIIANLSATYLVNIDGKIISIIYDSGINLNSDEKNVLNNTVDPNDDLIKSKYLEKLVDPNDKNKVAWDTVALDDKNKILKDLQNEINNKVEMYIKNLDAKLKKEDYYNNIIILYKNTFNKYILGDNFNHDDLIFISLIRDFLKVRKINYNRLNWISDYTIKIVIDKGPYLLFTNKRILKDQLNDLDTIIFYNKFNSAKLIDLRSVNYSITE